jgi:hypothetical protein
LAIFLIPTPFLSAKTVPQKLYPIQLKRRIRYFIKNLCRLSGPDRLIGAAVFIKIGAGFFDRIESDPIPPYGHFAMLAGKLDGRVSVVFVAIIIIRIQNVCGHFFPLFAVNDAGRLPENL